MCTTFCISQNFIGNSRSKLKLSVDHEKKDTLPRPQKLRKLNGYNLFARKCLQSEGTIFVNVVKNLSIAKFDDKQNSFSTFPWC